VRPTTSLWGRTIEITVRPDAVDLAASVRIAGDLDLDSVLCFRTTALSLESRTNADLRLDLSRVTFLDCAGLGGLEEWAAAVARRGGTTILAALSPEVRRLLSMTRTTLSA
jgi:anti-anti-sigma factor